MTVDMVHNPCTLEKIWSRIMEYKNMSEARISNKFRALLRDRNEVEGEGEIFTCKFLGHGDYLPLNSLKIRAKTRFTPF